MRTLIEDTLKQLEPEIRYTEDSANLVERTISQESAYGKYQKQIGGGPALGITQMEPATFNDLIENVLAYHPRLLAKIIEISCVTRLNSADLEVNDRLAICMCRVAYFRHKEQIPSTLYQQAKYWLKYYNTHTEDESRIDQFIENTLRYCYGHI